MSVVGATERGRFAPSPTGRLHFGSLVAAVGSWLFARQAGGQWLVRIDDLDRERTVPGAADGIVDTLRACGLEPDLPIVRQSERGALYAAALDALARMDEAYPCRCSRSELAPFGGRHPAACVAAPDDWPAPAWRLRVPTGTVVGFDDRLQGPQRQDLAGEVGDFVLWRRDGGASYQLAVVVDDADQGISEVVRGADLLASTARQIRLRQLLRLPPVRYAHLPLALGSDGRKLSKQDGALAIDPADPLPALHAALRFLGQPVSGARDPAALLYAAAREFDPGRIPRVVAAAPTDDAVRKDV